MFLFGALWYTFLFGKIWSELMGFTEEAMEKAKQGGMLGKMVIMFILNIISVSVIYYLLPQILALTFISFLLTTIIILFGFSFPVYMGAYLWEGKSWKLVCFNTVYGVLSFSIASAVIYFW